MRIQVIIASTVCATLLSVASACAQTAQTAHPLTAEQERAVKPSDSFKECDKCPEMMAVPPGSFMMGSPDSEAGHFDPMGGSDEAPMHNVTFAKPFAVGRFAVTFDEWDACVADQGCEKYRPKWGEGRADEKWGRGRQPAIFISWNDAIAYAGWLSRKTAKAYRLLSESEREYVTRAGTTTPFWWGPSISPSQANYNGKFAYGDGPKGENRARPLPVDSFQPNPWGLYQVHGNVWEWTEDCYFPSYHEAPVDGSSRTNCPRHENLQVFRGGSWVGPPANLRSANRYRNLRWYRGNDVGFRVARTL